MKEEGIHESGPVRGIRVTAPTSPPHEAGCFGLGWEGRPPPLRRGVARRVTARLQRTPRQYTPRVQSASREQRYVNCLWLRASDAQQPQATEEEGDSSPDCPFPRRMSSFDFQPGVIGPLKNYIKNYLMLIA